MPAPPPPPPPPPPPLSLSANNSQAPPKAKGNRAMLLSEIHKGAQLRKAVTNDRSAPAIGGKVVGNFILMNWTEIKRRFWGAQNSGSCIGKTSAPNTNSHQKMAAPKTAGTLNFGDLFKDGVPKKPSELKNQKALNYAASNSNIPYSGSQPRDSPVKKALLASTSDLSASESVINNSVKPKHLEHSQR